MANSRRKRLEREIDRDARVTTSGFVHEVVAATLGQLQRLSLASGCPDPVAMFDEVDAITRKFRSFHRRLNDARINRRGDRDRDAAPPAQLPPALRPFAYHGRYLGAFPNVEAFAHACIDPGRPELWASHVDLTQVGIDLHLSGRFWTVDDDGVTHAFALAEPSPSPSPALVFTLALVFALATAFCPAAAARWGRRCAASSSPQRAAAAAAAA
jgi:hypothetical protein